MHTLPLIALRSNVGCVLRTIDPYIKPELQVVPTLVVEHQVQALGFLIAGYAQSDHHVDDLEDHERRHQGINEGSRHPGGLYPQLTPDTADAIGEAVAAENTQLGGTEDPRQQGAQCF